MERARAPRWQSTLLRLSVSAMLLTHFGCMQEEKPDWIELLETGSRVDAMQGILDTIEAKQNEQRHRASLLRVVGKIESIRSLIERGETAFDAARARRDELPDEASSENLRAEIEALEAELTRREQELATLAMNLENQQDKKRDLEALIASLPSDEEFATYAQRHADALVQLYDTTTPERGEHCEREEIIETLRKLRVPNAAPTLIQAVLEDNANPPLDGLASIETLHAWAAPDSEPNWPASDALPRFVELLRKNLDGTQPLHYQLQQKLVAFVSEYGGASEQGLLLRILRRGPDPQPIFNIRAVAGALGRLGVDDAIGPLVECLWWNDARGRDAVSECRLALNHLDPAKVQAEVLRTLRRQNEAVEERAVRYHFAHHGLIESKAAMILEDIMARDGGAALIASLQRTEQLQADEQGDQERGVLFAKSQLQKTLSLARALAALGGSSGAQALLQVVSSEREFEHRLGAAQRLSYLGEASIISGRRGLMKLFEARTELSDIAGRDLQMQYAKTISLLLGTGRRDRSTRRRFGQKVTRLIQEYQEQKTAAERNRAQAEGTKTELDALLEIVERKVSEAERALAPRPAPAEGESPAPHDFGPAMETLENDLKAIAACIGESGRITRTNEGVCSSSAEALPEGGESGQDRLLLQLKAQILAAAQQVNQLRTSPPAPAPTPTPATEGAEGAEEAEAPKTPAEQALALAKKVRKLCKQSLRRIRGLIVQVGQQINIYGAWLTGYAEVQTQLQQAERAAGNNSYWARLLTDELLADRIAAQEQRVAAARRALRLAESEATVDCSGEGSAATTECQDVRQKSGRLATLEAALTRLRAETEGPEKRVSRVQAAYALSRDGVSRESAIRALLTGAESADSVVRDVSLFGISRHGTSADVPSIGRILERLERQLEGVSDRDNHPLSSTIFTLKLLQAHLRHRS